MKYKIKYYICELKESETIVNNPKIIFNELKKDFDIFQEHLYLFGMNTKNKIILKKEIAIGSHNTMIVNPKDIFTPLLMTGCNSFILAHNHPTKDINPSNEDIIFIKKVKKASDIMGLNLLDNLIFSNDNYYSFKQNEII